MSNHFLNCTPSSINNFPTDFFTKDERQQGAISIHIFVASYMVLCSYIVCDRYFIRSLEVICERLNIQSDVAGASFMAAGGSTPELFTALIAVFFANSDVGLGTIVGSGVFNSLCIIALVSFISGKVLHLNWWPVLRDTTCYCISILVLVLFIHDETILWYEALTMLLLYFLYIMLLVGNRHIEVKLEVLINFLRKKRNHGPDAAAETDPLLKKNEVRNFESTFPQAVSTPVKIQDSFNCSVRTIENSIVRPANQSQLISSLPILAYKNDTHTEIILPSGPMKHVKPFWDIPSGHLCKIYWFISLPISIILFFTIPDCTKQGFWRKLYFVTFFTSIIWLAMISYILVWMASIVGDTFNIPASLMGLTVLAIGTSMPDALSSVLVAKDGLGDMAICNCLGSNVFDILFCLGLPWLMKTAFIKPGSAVFSHSDGLSLIAMILLFSSVFLLFLFFINRWKINKKVGVTCLLMYILIITVTCFSELNFFGKVNLPPCVY